MSDKRFTTDEIIESLQSVMNVLFAERAYSTIAKLRAADRLCEAAKGLGWMRTIYPHIDLSKISKAIADYKEKK
jgi:hypothetical protein